jgi:hypothetical protein
MSNNDDSVKDMKKTQQDAEAKAQTNKTMLRESQVQKHSTRQRTPSHKFFNF